MIQNEKRSQGQKQGVAIVYAVSGRIGKVVASHVAVARTIPAEVALIYTMHEALMGYCP